MNSDKIAVANAKVFGTVHGWLGERVYQVIQAAAEAFTANNVTGSIVEIGIHHGKFFFIIDRLRNQGEVSIAIDIFDQQEKMSINQGKAPGEASKSIWMTSFPESVYISRLCSKIACHSRPGRLLI